MGEVDASGTLPHAKRRKGVAAKGKRRRKDLNIFDPWLADSPEVA
jgi:hypothetical protein